VGQKRKCRPVSPMSALPPESGHSATLSACPKSANIGSSGHDVAAYRQKQRNYSRVSFRTWGPMTRYRRVKFLNASARRSNCFPVRPNGVTIRRQGTKAPVKTLEARDRRSPLTTWRMSRIAKGSYCRARCSQKQALAQIAKSGGLRFRSELLAVLASGRGGCQCWRFLTRTRLRYAQPH